MIDYIVSVFCVKYKYGMLTEKKSGFRETTRWIRINLVVEGLQVILIY